MVMPGRSRTSCSACAARVPPPFGRPRLAPPEVLARRPPRRRRGAALAAVAAGLVAPLLESAEGLVGGQEQLVLLDGRLEFLQARLDLFALLVEKIGHLSVTPGERVNGDHTVSHCAQMAHGSCRSVFK